MPSLMTPIIIRWVKIRLLYGAQWGWVTTWGHLRWEGQVVFYHTLIHSVDSVSFSSPSSLSSCPGHSGCRQYDADPRWLWCGHEQVPSGSVCSSWEPPSVEQHRHVLLWEKEICCCEWSLLNWLRQWPSSGVWASKEGHADSVCVERALASLSVLHGLLWTSF